MRIKTGAIALMLLVLLASPGVLRAAWQVNDNLVLSGMVEEDLGSGVITSVGNGVIISWIKSSIYNSYANSGNVKCDLDGAMQGIATYECSRWGGLTQLAPDGAGGAFGVGTGLDAAGKLHICPCHIYSDGSEAGFGVHPFDFYDSPRNPRVIACSAGGAIVVWDCSNPATGTGYDIFAQRVDAANTRLWGTNAVTVIAAAGDQKLAAIDTDGSNGVIICWQSGGDLYAQRVTFYGSLQWDAGGVSICTAAGTQDEQKLLADGAGGAFIVWRDARSGTADIYMQHINSDGGISWTADGVAVCTAAGAQEYPVPVLCGGGGAYVAWSDPRSGDNDVYAQRIDASGSPQWTSDGIVVSGGSGYQGAHEVVSDLVGNAIVAWVDDKNGDYDIYAQKLDPAGNAKWKIGGVPVCTATGNQSWIVMTSDGIAGAIVAWRDYRRWSWGDIYAARLREDILPVEALLQSFSAAVEGSSVRITWTLAASDREPEFAVVRTDVASSLSVTLDNEAITRELLEYTFIDESCEPGRTYRYRVDAVDESGSSTLFETQDIMLPGRAFSLGQNYPNPFNPRTAIQYSVPERAHVTLDIFDVVGRRLVRLVDRELSAGGHVAEWDGMDSGGKMAVSGIYFYRLRAGSFTETKKMTLTR